MSKPLIPILKPSIRALCFLLGLSALVGLTGRLFSAITWRLDYNEPKVKMLGQLHHCDYDVLFLGNSIAQQAINPVVIDTKLGTNSYNLAMGGATFVEMKLVLQAYLRQNRKPRLVVYGVPVNYDGGDFQLRPSVRLSLPPDLQQAYHNFLRAQGQTPNRLAEWVEHLPAYRFRSAPEMLVKYLAQGQKRVPVWIKGHLALNFPFREPKTYHEHLTKINRVGLDYFVRFCQEQGIPLLLIECPNSEIFNRTVLNRAEVLAIPQSFAGVDFVSFNEGQFTSEASDWVSLNHLSASGAVKFSTSLAVLLEHRLP